MSSMDQALLLLYYTASPNVNALWNLNSRIAHLTLWSLVLDSKNTRRSTVSENVTIHGIVFQRGDNGQQWYYDHVANSRRPFFGVSWRSLS